MSDAELVEGIRAGRIDYAVLVKRYEGTVRGWLWPLLRSSADVDEVCQCVFIRSWLRLERFNPEAGLSTWLRRLTERLAFSFLRRRQRQPLGLDQLAEADLPAQEGPAEQVERSITAQRLWQLVSELPELEQETLLDRFLLGRTWVETGRDVGRSERQARYYAAHALATLRERLMKTG